MVKKFNIFNGLLLIVSGLIVGISIEAATGEAADNETKSLSENKLMFSNNTANKTSFQSDNGTIILDAGEVSDGQYRWIGVSDKENPTLNITANKDYTFKISNPTDKEHQLIIDSKADGKGSEIAKSTEIKPEKQVEFNFKTDQAGELEYHCKYHPDVMK
jgi:hypothetical protein